MSLLLWIAAAGAGVLAMGLACHVYVKRGGYDYDGPYSDL